MDNRDEIIQTQMDLISTLVNNNLRNIADDLWGAPTPKSPAPKSPEGPVDGPKTPYVPGKAPTPTAAKAPNLKAPMFGGMVGFGAVRGATGVPRKRACRVFGGSRVGNPQRNLHSISARAAL